MVEYEECSNYRYRLEKEIKELKEIIIAIYDNDNSIPIQKLVEKIRGEVR